MEGNSISSNLEGNPFASLFPTLEVAVAYRESQAKLEQEKPTELMVIETEEQLLPKDAISPICDENVKQTQDLNNIIEEVFLVTLNKYSAVGGSQQQLVHLSSLAEVIIQNISFLLSSLIEPNRWLVLTPSSGWTCPHWSRPSSRG